MTKQKSFPEVLIELAVVVVAIFAIVCVLVLMVSCTTKKVNCVSYKVEKVHSCTKHVCSVDFKDSIGVMVPGPTRPGEIFVTRENEQIFWRWNAARVSERCELMFYTYDWQDK